MATKQIRPNANGEWELEEASNVSSPSRTFDDSTFFDVDDFGEKPDKNAYDDTFEYGPFRFFIRQITREKRFADSQFPTQAIKQLGLDKLAEEKLDNDLTGEERNKAIRERALSMLTSEDFAGDKTLFMQFDRLLHNRLDAVIVGDPDSDNPDDWGGLVKWGGKGVRPYSPEAAKSLKLRMKLKLYERIIALSGAGVDDAQFRRANGSSAR